MKQIIQSILHPTDFSESSIVAFGHALRMALASQAKITLLHVTQDADSSSWSDFPGVRQTLEKWKVLPADSPRSAVPELGIDARKLIAEHDDPVRAVDMFLHKHPAELIVLATHQRRGAIPWLNNSVAEPIARHNNSMTLFISGDTPGFVSAMDGSISLRSVLIPVADIPEAQPAIDTAARLVESLGCKEGTFTLFHVGGPDSMPEVVTPDVPGWQWTTDVREGEVIQTIIDASRDAAADLIVMATDGRNGFLDALRGSHSERVLRLAGMPILTVPVGKDGYDAD